MAKNINQNNELNNDIEEGYNPEVETKDIHEGMPNYVKAPQKPECWFSRVFGHHTVEYIVMSIISIILFLVIVGLNGFNNFKAYADASTSVAVINLCFSGLAYVTREGTFDSLGYGFSRLFVTLFTGHYKHKDLYEFRLAQEDRRRKSKYTWAPYLLLGLILLVVAIIVNISYNQYISQFID